MKKKLTIGQVLECNRVLYRFSQQGNIFPSTVGFRLFRTMKLFDEVEEYVFNTMEMTFGEFDLENMNDEQEKFFNGMVSSEVELDIEDISPKVFEDNEKLALTLRDVEVLTEIFSEK